MSRSAAAVALSGSLRDHAFEAHRLYGLIKSTPSGHHVLTELDCAARWLDQAPQAVLSFDKGQRPKILTVEMKKVQGHEGERFGIAFYLPPQGMEVRRTGQSCKNHLAGENCRC